MTRIRRINVSQVEGGDANSTDTGEIRPFGEAAFYIDGSPPAEKLTLMMFDGVRTHRDSKVLSPGVLWGSSADAGDGSGADTIKLIPDAELFANGSDQYIVVDPTGGEPGHIHLRAGGTQDNSSADLYIGGEQTFVRVSDVYDNVVIRTSTVGEGIMPHTWTFDNAGQLEFPDGTIQTTAFTGGSDTLDSVTDRGATTTNNITVGAVITTDVTGKTAPAVGYNISGVPFPEGAGLNNTWTWVSSGAEVTQLIALGNSLIGAQVTQSEFPGTVTVIGLPNLGGTLGIELDGVIIYSPTNTLTFISTNYAPATPLPLDINVGNNTWTFDTNGDLSLPNGITVMGGAPSLIVETGNNLGIGTSRLQSASANCAIAAGDEFVADIEFNDDITVVQVGWTVVVGGTTYTVTAIDPAPPANQYRITAAGAPFVQSTTYTFTNPTPIPSAWVFGNDGSLTTPGSGIISHLANDLRVEVSGTDVIVLRTDGGELVVNSDASLMFNDGTIQTTAWTGIVTKSIQTVSVSTPTVITADVVFGDPNEAGANVNLILPASPANGTVVTVKNINPGSFVVRVTTNGIDSMEDGLGGISNAIYRDLSNSGEFITWIYQSSGSVYRIIG